MRNILSEKKIGVIGIGNMGRCIVESLLEYKELILVDKKMNDSMRRLAHNKKAIIAESYQQLKEADIIIFALTPDVSIKVASIVKPICKKDAILINISTFIDRDAFCSAIPGHVCYFIKIIGEAGEIMEGNTPFVVVQKKNTTTFENELFNALFHSFGRILFSENEFYSQINSIAASEIVKAIVVIENLLKANYISNEIITTVVCNVMLGTVKTYPWGKDDDFINKIKKMIALS